MTTNFSMWELIQNASLVVQLVMLGLFLTSLTSWMYIFYCNRMFARARARLAAFEFDFSAGGDLQRLQRKVNLREGAPLGLDAIFSAGFKEYCSWLKAENIAVDKAAIIKHSRRAMRIVLAREIEKSERYLPFLATVQSISPYVGLFGTVWGIMHSFRQLASVQQVTLSMVAPGISEALIATAIGLLAAIPAGIAYNRFVGIADRLNNRYQLFIDEFTGILQRQVQAG